MSGNRRDLLNEWCRHAPRAFLGGVDAVISSLTDEDLHVQLWQCITLRVSEPLPLSVTYRAKADK
jgi:hypothetical protein